MSRTFAFKVSLVDMIRKLGYRYEDPVDYVDTFVSALYHPGANLDIQIGDDTLILRSDASLDEKVLADLGHGNILALAGFIPPTTDYKIVTIRSGNHKVIINNNEKRRIHTSSIPSTESWSGTEVVIQRKKNPQTHEERRLRKLYQGSDLNVQMDGESVAEPSPSAFPFQHDGFAGTISYDRYAQGSMNYFSNGRFVAQEPFVSGLTLNLHRHPFKPTVTRSKVITRGRGKEAREQLETLIPNLLIEFLDSSQVAELRSASGQSYQTILRSVLVQYSKDPQIRQRLEQDLRFADTSGRIKSEYTADFVRVHPELFVHSRDAHALELLPSQPSSLEKDRQFTWAYRILAGLTAATLFAGIGFQVYNFTRAQPVSVVTGSASPVSGDSEQYDLELVRQLRERYANLPGLSFKGNFSDFVGYGSQTAGGMYWSRSSFLDFLVSSMVKHGREFRGGGSGGDLPSYTPQGLFNQLICGTQEMTWSGAQPYNVLSLKDCHLPLPQEIAERADRNSPLEDKLTAVGEYLAGFRYDVLDPSVASKYPDVLTALATERAVICHGAVSLGAIFLHELGVRDNLRVARGRLGGMPHLWLEVNKGTPENSQWEVYDFTPTHASSAIMAAMQPLLLPSDGASDASGLETAASSLPPQFPSRVVHHYQQGSSPSGSTNKPNLFTIPTDLGKVLLYESLFFLGLLGLAYGTKKAYTARLRRSYETARPFSLDHSNRYQQESAVVRDLLGVHDVAVRGDGLQYDHRKKSLTLPSEYFARADPVSVAVRLVSELPLTDRQRLDCYRRMIDIMRR